jgi:hypothetical protein
MHGARTRRYAGIRPREIHSLPLTYNVESLPMDVRRNHRPRSYLGARFFRLRHAAQRAILAGNAQLGAE